MTSPPKDDTILQVSGRDADGNWILSGLAKRTYRFDAAGRCELTSEQPGLVRDPVYPEGNADLLLADIDTWPFKPKTDVVVLGHAYNYPRGESFDATVSVGDASKVIRMTGDRRALLSHDGRIVFSLPARVDRVPLSYALAYGGRDAVTEAMRGNPAEELRPYLPASAFPNADAVVAAASPCRYPRNPAGRGYVVDRTKAAIEAAQLPNLEDPTDLLSPERFIPEDPWHWPAQPLPASFGWMDYGWFPRIAWLGMVLDCELPDDRSRVGEIRLGYARPELFEESPDPEPRIDFAGTNGASLGLRVPHLQPGARIELTHLSPHTQRLQIQLPGERPQIRVDGRKGKRLETVPVIHTLIVEPDLERLSIVWRGAARAIRSYLPAELPNMPFSVSW